MSRLPKAPLLEVIFELKWKITNKDDLTKYQYLTGDLYSKIKERYPRRQTSIPPEFPIDLLISKPVHKYSVQESAYPLVQLGPGIVTLNTNDNNYFWEEYYAWAKELIGNLFEVYSMNQSEKFQPSLIYIDFLVIDFEKNNILDYLSEKMNIKISQNFLFNKSNPKALNFGISQEVDNGVLNISFNTGRNKEKETGLVIETKLIGNEFDPDSNIILEWLDSGHKLCSSLFKEMTKGDLYESFK